ncbi:MAG: DNA gyrase subunit A [Gammaproteobacteria bacterium]|nr:DNA gyrase subunit A [Gammaproteobacteria bacterium]
MTETVAKEIISTNIVDEMKQSYMEYAMSVIVGRALPDVRDGLKPVHRRVLFAMHGLGNDWNKPYKKSARIVGDVIGKYHPHGDSAVYDTIVRMAQPFSLRYMLVDGQGNFGSIDGDAPAAMRYTEVRMSRIAHELLADLDKQTVDFSFNYDETEQEPVVMPTRVPNLLVNGSAGIAVGLATNIPPHNLREIVDACLAVIDTPEISIAELIEIVPGPDFPTAAIINGTRGIQEAYATGRGRIHVRARTAIETNDKTGRQRIIVHELPYQVNKALLLEKIAQLVRDKRIEGITELRDESDKDGMRMVIELRRGEMADVVLNNLYQHTQLQNVFGINMVALVDGQPRLLNLKQMLEYFIQHRREVVTRRSIFELAKARDRGHVLEGLAVALVNIDPIIALIKAAKTSAEAKAALTAQTWPPGIVTEMLARSDASATRPQWLDSGFGLVEQQAYRLSEVQAQAILDLRLHRLTGLEQDKIVTEYREVLVTIGELLEILSNPDRLRQVIRDELAQIREQFGDARRTEILSLQHDLTIADLITEEDVVVTLSNSGYVKYQALDVYQAQRRGGRGKMAATVKEEDFIDKLFIANTHDTILCFSSRGKVYWKKVYELPQAARQSRGRPIVNLLSLEEGERISAVLPVRDYADDKFIFMATHDGYVKKTALSEFSRPRSSGIIAIDLVDDDRLIGVTITDGTREILLMSSAGKAIRFHEQTVRPMGRSARGVHGIKLQEGQQVIASLVAEDGDVLTVTEFGYGKRTPVAEYPLHGRAGQGVISIQTTERNGKVIGAVLVHANDEIMLISDSGTLVRTRVDEISVQGRNTQGVRLIRMADNERLAGLDRCEGESAAEE